MKNLFFILLLGLGFTQTELTTRVYTISVSNLHYDNPYFIDISTLTGYDLDFAILEFHSASNFILNTDINIQLQSLYTNYSGNEVYGGTWMKCSEYGCQMYEYQRDVYYNEHNTSLKLDSQCCFTGDITLLVTAEFPQEDTGYIEDGFEFCVQPGANLLSFPCDNPISVSASLPEGSENFIESIIGQGVATEYNPSLGWIGSLAEFTPGSGYWFKSNESLCFEYECVEN